MNRIVIIDDLAINLTLLTALASKLGDCESIVFQESRKGLAWCSENQADLIVVDYMMPAMDGIEFIARLRAVAGREEVPILMITANDNKDVRYERSNRPGCRKSRRRNTGALLWQSWVWCR